MKRKIKIEVIADVVCPWCYIGEHRLQQAIEAEKDHLEVSLHFRPFELNPDLPEEGVDHLQYLAVKFGGVGRVEAMHQQMTEMAAAEDIPFDFHKIKTSPNTFKAHRLIWLSEKYHLQQETVAALYRAFFLEGKNVGDEKTLIQVGIENGIPADEFNTFFQGEKGVTEVRALEQEAYRMGINAVPAFIINGQFLVRGAQPVSVFREVLEKVAPPVQEIVTEGQSCDGDQCDL